jgi:hypothetical protein
LEETKNGVPCYLLELQAKAKNVTYDKINYWISKKENLGVFAEFMTVSGEKFKSASFEYKNKLVARGEQIPFVSEMKITDAHNPSNVTIIRYKEPKEVSLPDAAFNVNNLTR